jgi:hypothetical protein
MIKHLNLFLLPLLFLSSCDRINKLSKEDYLWMPYKGNETLVFKSNKKETNTVYILKKDTLLAYPEAQAINGIKYEEVSVFCNHYGQNKKDALPGYYFFIVQKSKDNRAELIFDLSTEDAVFYRIRPVKIDSLSRIQPIVLQTSYGQYNDIYIISPDNLGKQFYDRSNFVTKLYWSKSRGLIRYDKKNGEYWELING